MLAEKCSLYALLLAEQSAVNFLKLAENQRNYGLWTNRTCFSNTFVISVNILIWCNWNLKGYDNSTTELGKFYLSILICS